MISYARRAKELERRERLIRRGERERAAGKLVSKVPELARLDIAIREAPPAGCVDEKRYIRRVVLEHAPALFEVPCSGAHCEDGGYDVTREFLLALASRRVQFEGQQVCRGRCRSGDCARVLEYVATATYHETRHADPAGPVGARDDH
jgi:hypothetical protein